MSEEPHSIGALDPLLGYHLRRASGAFAGDFMVAMEGTGMRQVLFAILAVVSSNPGMNQGAAGRVLGIKRTNMVSLINELTEAGLIAREADVNDRRALALTITPAGSAKLDECLERIEEHERRMLTAFTERERTTLLELLAKIERRESAVC